MQVSRRTWMMGAATLASVGAHAWWKQRAPRPDGIRVVDWNLRKFSGSRTATSRHAPGHDVERLRDQLHALDADVFCFQEVLDPAVLAGLLPGYQVQSSTEGGAHGQYLMVAHRSTVTAPAPAYTDRRLVIAPGLRPTLVHALRWGSRSTTFVVVHLKAGPAGYALRMQQHARLAEQLAALPRPRIVVGDFNTAGAPSIPPQQEIASLVRCLETVGLQPVAPSLPCTAYWEGRFDRFKQPSILDHVFCERAASGAPPLHVAPGNQCARYGCEVLVSTDAYPDLDYERVSDHCPLVLDLPG
jgi:endonuclease/exonuclease/phosphatase family metal-dependent hydrolase